MGNGQGRGRGRGRGRRKTETEMESSQPVHCSPLTLSGGSAVKQKQQQLETGVTDRQR
jgi:hypothetical protein